MTDLSALKVPGPTIIALTAPFWDAAAQGRLEIQHCPDCDTHVFYPREICPHCWSDRLVWRAVSGDGVLKSFSVIWKPGHPGWLPAAPYVVGLVRLAEGPTMLSHILTHGAEPVVGARLRWCPTTLGGRVMPLFEIAPA